MLYRVDYRYDSSSKFFYVNAPNLKEVIKKLNFERLTKPGQEVKIVALGVLIDE